MFNVIGVGKNVLRFGVGAGYVGYNVYSQRRYVNEAKSQEEFWGRVAESSKNILIFGSGFYHGEKYATVPLITRFKPQQTSTSFVGNQMYKLDILGQERLHEKYRIKTKVIPAEIEVSTRAREWFGMPKVREYSPIGKTKLKHRRREAHAKG